MSNQKVAEDSLLLLMKERLLRLEDEVRVLKDERSAAPPPDDRATSAKFIEIDLYPFFVVKGSGFSIVLPKEQFTRPHRARIAPEDIVTGCRNFLMSVGLPQASQLVVPPFMESWPRTGVSSIIPLFTTFRIFDAIPGFTQQNSFWTVANAEALDLMPKGALDQLAFVRDCLFEMLCLPFRLNLGGGRGGKLPLGIKSGLRLMEKLLPERFALADLEEILQAADPDLVRDSSNFRKRLLATGWVVDTGETLKEGAHRPARLFRMEIPGV